MVYAMLNSLARRFAGRTAAAVASRRPSDPFGVSEGVCRGCRG